MKRKVYSQLLEWKNRKDRKPLILNGARQVGKTWLLREFGKNEFESVAYFSCDRMAELKEVFAMDFDTTRIIRSLSALSGVDILPGKTLIIIDEIQQLPVAITSLKYFCEDAPAYHIAVAGSLLGVFLHEGFSFPVGKVDMIKVYPMVFDEFLEAHGKLQLLEVLRARDYDVINPLNGAFVEELRQYYFTGGMPAAVAAYVNGEGLNRVREIQKLILFAYSNDFSKHVEKQVAQRINMVWQNIPSQLAKENKRFVYGALKKGARASEFELAIEWLVNAGLVYKVDRVKQPLMPLKFYEDFSAFKLFLLDCGLLGAMTDTPAAAILVGDSIFKEYKGTFTELFVLQQLKAIDSIPVFYYSSSDSQVEIDFMAQCGVSVIPLEVKAEENLRAKSLHQFVDSHPGLTGMRFSMSGYRCQSWMENVPLYAAGIELAARCQL
jgi:uncharacterized protein